MLSVHATSIASTPPLHVGGFRWTGDFTAIDLIAASTNALNGALLARRPDHYRRFTLTGIVLMAVIGGIGGGVVRDLLAGDVPEALTNPAYLTVSVAFGLIGFFTAYSSGQLFREGMFQFMTSFSLPWYAIVGAQKGVDIGLPIWGCVALAIVGPTAGRWFIDTSCRVTPKLFVRGEFFVVTAVLTSVTWLTIHSTGLGTWPAAGVAFVVGFSFRVTALYRGWEEPMPKGPKGVKMHGDNRPLLGRKLTGKSRAELRALGLTVPDDHD